MSKKLDCLVACLSRLDGIGNRSAQRLAMQIVSGSQQHAAELAEAIIEASSLGRCSVCNDISDSETCAICLDVRRDASVIYVVARTQDRVALDRAGFLLGRYHVLGGLLDPINGVGPKELAIRQLLERLRSEVEEVVVATSPTAEGDATALYLSKLISPCGVIVTRLASGVAVGSDIEFADETTIRRALEHRQRME